MSAEFLYDCWYVATPAKHLKSGKTLARTILNQSILLGRDKDGKVFALRDFCPHRGIPLRYGNFDGTTIECCYHGWCFNTQGMCTSIPSLTPEDKVDISRIKAMRFPCEERNGVVWIYMPAPKAKPPETLPALPTLPVMTERAHTSFYWVDSVEFPCDIDHAIIGLMDPSHGPFVHASWWWRSKRSMHVKQKKFVPFGMGFKMVKHKPSANSRAYRILTGGEVATEIAFQLPGLRTEHIAVGQKHIVLLTALTPIDETRTALHQFFYTDIGILHALTPLLRPFGKAFIRQDLTIVKKQQEGLRGEHPPLLLLGGADTQALWYYKLKKDYLEAKQTNTPFQNRVPERVLSWRS